MSNKHIKELKNLSKDELQRKIREAEELLFQSKLKKSTGQLEDVGTIWKTRKNLARMKMLATQQGIKV